jgi:glycosyltransferase involved in cell wall biosynthesis
LESVAGHFDHYAFTDTGSVDGSRVLVENFLKAHRGVLSDFAWVDDFSAARNFCFDQSPARWRMFLDTDDQLVGGEKVRKLLVKCEAQHPQVEGFFVKYEYDRLEELPSMRIARWREGWRFNDAIHERLEFAYPDGEGLPDTSFGRTDEFLMRHKPKTKEEKVAAIRRNTIIARKEMETATDPKYRARLARTLAMELKMDGHVAEAIPLWEQLYALYKSYPEGRQAAADISKTYQYLAEKGPRPERDNLLTKALDWGKKAGPAYEGLIRFSLDDHMGVIKAAQRSAGMGQQATHEGFIFEQGAIYITAAGSALKLGMNPAVAERLINRVPPKLRNDEVIMPHVNAVRREVDRITILVPSTPQPFDENGGGGMLGGSEEAVMYLTRELAALGRNVRVFGVLPPHRIPGPDKYGVDWQPIESWNADDEAGTLVLWRAPGLLLKLMQEAAKRGNALPGVIQAFLWLHDSGLGVHPQHVPHLGAGCNAAIVLSDFHERMIRRCGYNGRFVHLSNGITETDFAPFIDEVAFDLAPVGDRDPYSVVYSSCPSRGLVQLLHMWPRVKAAVPQAKLDIYYDWSMLEAFQPQKYDEVVKLYETVQHLDVKHHGGVDHDTLHTALRKANVWAYSHFESPEVETFCISSVKALAAGSTVLTVPNGALPEVTAGDAHFVTSTEDYERRLIEFLKEPEGVAVRRERARRALTRYGWKAVAERFSKVWSFRDKMKPSDYVPIDAFDTGTTVAT